MIQEGAKQRTACASHVSAMPETVEQLHGFEEEKKVKSCKITATVQPSRINAVHIRSEVDVMMEYIEGKLIDDYSCRKELQTDEATEKPEAVFNSDEVRMD